MLNLKTLFVKWAMTLVLPISGMVHYAFIKNEKSDNLQEI